MDTRQVENIARLLLCFALALHLSNLHLYLRTTILLVHVAVQCAMPVLRVASHNLERDQTGKPRMYMSA